MKRKSKPVFVLKADSDGIRAMKDGKIQPVSRYFLKHNLNAFKAKLPKMREA